MQEEKDIQIIGKEAKVLSMKTTSLLRKYETKTGMYRPDLSYTPEK